MSICRQRICVAVCTLILVTLLTRFLVVLDYESPFVAKEDVEKFWQEKPDKNR